MLYPPSLPPQIRLRAFQAVNGELGLMVEDTSRFLDACKHDRIDVLGWELWLADCRENIESGKPVEARGFWCGLIPMRNDALPNVVHGEGGLDEVREQLASLNELVSQIDPRWVARARVNFTLAE